MIFGGGPNGASTVSGLRAFLPATELTPVTLSTLPGLETFTGESVPDQGPYLATIPQSIRGQIDIVQENNALLISDQVGLGRVVYFALDFGLAPMNGWAGNDAFWEAVLDPIEAQTPYYLAYNGLGNLNNALANIDVAVLPSPVLLMLFLCAYIIILVPVNYLVLAYFKRRELAWVTIPALIIMFSLAGYIGGFRARGGQGLLRQISVIQQPDISDDGLLDVPANVDTFIGLYSPNRGQYTLKFEENLLVKPTDSGSGYSGVKDTSSAPTTILYGGNTELQNLWTDVGTMATAVAHGRTAPQPISLNLAVDEQNGQWRISGTIQNNSNARLEDAVLLVGDRGIQISDLSTGQTEIDYALRQLSVVNNYNDTTIWGDYYYQTNNAQIAVNDQIIRSIFWPDYGFRPQQTLTPNDEPKAIILFGWQTDAPASTDIEVVGNTVDREAVNLLIIRKTL